MGLGEVRAVVCQHRMNLIGDGRSKGPEEVAGDTPRRFLVQLEESKLRGPVDRHEQVELAFLGLCQAGSYGTKPLNNSSPDHRRQPGNRLDLGRWGLSPSTSGSREMPWRWRQRCSDERVRCGIDAWSA